MGAKEIYNIDLQINTTGVDKAISQLQKADKAVEKFKKNASKMKKVNLMYGVSGVSKAEQKINKLHRSTNKLSRMKPKITVDIQDKATQKLNKLNTALGTNQMLLKSQMNQRNQLFKNSTMGLMMGKPYETTYTINADEKVTTTVNKAQASIQNFKHNGKVKATLTASNNQASKVISDTTNKAKKYSSGKYVAILEAKEKMSGTIFAKGYGKVKSFGKKALGQALRYGSMTAAALGGFGLTSMVKQFGEYQAQMSALKAVANLNTQEFKALDNQAKHLGATTEWSSKQVAEGMTMLGQSGFKTQEIMKAMPGLLNLASAGGLQLSEASSIASGTLRAFGLQVGQTGHVADVLALTASSTNTTVSELGTSMEYAAPFAKGLGVSIENTAAAIGLLGNVNIRGSKAGMAMRNMFTSLAAPTDKAQKLMKQLGFNAFDAQGKMKDFPTVISELKRSTQGLNDQQKMSFLNGIFGDVGANAALSLLSTSNEQLSKLSNNLRNSQGAADKMAKTRIDNLMGDFKILQSAAQNMMISLGEKLAPKLREFMQWLTGKMPEIQAGLEGIMDGIMNNGPAILGGLKAALGLFAAFKGIQFANGIKNAVEDFKTLGSVINGLSGGNLAGLFGGITSGASSAGGATKMLGTAIGGLGMSGGAIIALGSAFMYLSMKISDSASKIADIQNKLGGLGVGITGFIEAIGSMGEALDSNMKSGSSFFEGFEKLFTGDFKGAKHSFKQGIADLAKSSIKTFNKATLTNTYGVDVIRDSTKKQMRQSMQVLQTGLNQQKNLLTGHYSDVAKAMAQSLRGANENTVAALKTNETMGTLLSNLGNTSNVDKMAKTIGENLNMLSMTKGFDPKKMLSGFEESMRVINGNVKDSAMNVKQSLSDMFNSFKDTSTTSGVKSAVNGMLQDIQMAGPAIQSMIMSNKQAMEGAFKGIDFAKPIQEQMSQVMSNLGNMSPVEATNALRGIFSSLGQMASQEGQKAGQQFSQSFNSGINTGASLPTNMYNGIGNAAAPEGTQHGANYGQAFNAGVQQTVQQNPIKLSELQVQGGGTEHVQAQIAQMQQATSQANQLAQQVKQAYTNMYNGASNSVRQLQSVTTASFSALSASANAQVAAMCSQIIAKWNAMKAVVSSTVTAHFVLSVSTVGSVGAIPHADGGIFSRPHLGLVAEAGEEAVIPLSPSKRGRGLELFAQAGEMLGINMGKGNNDENKSNSIYTNATDSISNKTYDVNNAKSDIKNTTNANNINVNVTVNSNNKHNIVKDVLREVERDLEKALEHID